MHVFVVILCVTCMFLVGSASHFNQTWIQMFPDICGKELNNIAANGFCENSPCLPPPTINPRKCTPLMSFLKVLPHLVTALKWTHVWVVHDASLCNDMLMQLSDELFYSKIKVTAFEVNNTTTPDGIQSHLHIMYKQMSPHQRNVLILCSKLCLQRVISQMNQFDDINSNRTALLMFTGLLVFLHDCRDLPDIHLDNVAVVLTSRDQSTDNTKCGRKMELFTLLYKDNGRKQSFVGETSENGTVSFTSDIFPNIKQGFNRRKLVIGTQMWYPFVMGSIQSGFQGLCIDFLHTLADKLNFTYEITLPKDGEWGREINGTWTGLVAGLQTREMDLVIAPLTVIAEREAVIDFSFPYYFDVGVGIYRKPNSTSKWMQLLKPFQYPVHIILVISVGTTLVFLLCIEESHWMYVAKQKHMRPNRRLTAVVDILTFLVGSLFTRFGNGLTLSSAGRVFIGFWWMFCTIIAAVYCGNLVAFLTVSKPPHPFEPLAQIAAQTEYTWGTTGGSAWTTVFETSNTSTLKELGEKMEVFSRTDPDVVSRSQDVHRNKVLAGSYIFFGNKDSLKTWTVDNCGLELTKESFFSYNYGVGLQQDSPFYGDISRAILQMEQDGLFSKWKRRWFPKDSKRCEANIKTVSVSLDHFHGVLLLAAIGITLSGIVLVMEMLTRKHLK